MTHHHITSKHTHHLEIEVNEECDHYEPRFATYGTIVTQGETLEELINHASIDIIDQDGGELDTVPADQEWMEKLIVDAYYEKIAPRNRLTILPPTPMTFGEHILKGK
jgi:hypothetical protein